MKSLRKRRSPKAKSTPEESRVSLYPTYLAFLSFRGEESHSFVKQLMNLHEQFRNIVRDCFRDAQLFQKGLQEV